MGFWFRIGPTPSRLGGPVVRDVVSCLEGIVRLGIDDSGSGCNILWKCPLGCEMGGEWRSKVPGTQYNHGG